MPTRVPRRPLGSTGLEVSIIGFGASPLGNVFGVRDGGVGVHEILLRRSVGVNLLQEKKDAHSGSPIFCPQDVSQDTATEAVRTAFDLGITLFDTSPFYGLTKSESVRRGEGVKLWLMKASSGCCTR